MFFKIFISVLILTCVYTYMLKSIEDENETNFQKLPDNFNFELNEIQTVKPNLKDLEFSVLTVHLTPIFGQAFVDKIANHYTESVNLLEVFNKDILSKLKECKTPEEQKNIFSNDISSILEKKMNVEEQKQIKNDLDYHQDKYQRGLKNYFDRKSWLDQIKFIIKYIETD